MMRLRYDGDDDDDTYLSINPSSLPININVENTVNTDMMTANDAYSVVNTLWLQNNSTTNAITIDEYTLDTAVLNTS